MSFEAADVAHFALIVAEEVDHHGGWCYSWGRDVVRNNDVQGNEESRHLAWCAADCGFYIEGCRDDCYTKLYMRGMHGYKKEFIDPETEKIVYGFHIQDRPADPPGR